MDIKYIQYRQYGNSFLCETSRNMRPEILFPLFAEINTMKGHRRPQLQAGCQFGRQQSRRFAVAFAFRAGRPEIFAQAP